MVATLLTVAIIIISVAIITLGVLTYLRNPREAINRSFLLLSFFAGIWQLFNYFGSNIADFSIAQPLIYADYATGIMLAWSFWFFSYEYYSKINKKKPSTLLTASLLIVSASLALLGSYGLVASPVLQNGTFILSNQFFYQPYTVVVFALILLGTSSLIIARQKAANIVRLQLTTILTGLLFASLLISIPNLLLPDIVNNQRLLDASYNLSYVGLLFFAITTSYAIIRHRLFDLRLIVARSVAYSLVIATLSLLYGFVVFGFIDQFFPDANMGILQQSIYVISAIFLAFTFQPLRRFFDKWTDRIFYRDNYETEDILNKLGKIFVAKSNDFELLNNSLQIITDTLKTQDSSIVVLDEGKIYKTTSTSHDSEANISVNALQQFENQLTIYDEVQENGKLYSAFRELNAYAVLRLTVQDELVGYLILGSKQTGTIFTQQDVNLLEILAQELAVAIQNVKSYQKIANFSKTLQREVEEATAQLRESNQRLRKLDEAKDEFISMASHQLRTPLTTIKGYLSMLLDGDAGKLNKNQRQFIDQAFIGSQRMVYLISDMLNVSRISTGKLTIDKNSLNITDVIESEVDQLQQQAETRDVQLTFHPPDEGEIWLELDEGKIRQVAMNFIDNAIYYAPKGTVDVYVEKTDGSVECRVVDDGIGVSEEAQKQLFTKFFRAENARHVRPDGTGLGLYMAKQVVEAQGGEVIFESTEGEGSTFGFRFPLENQKVDQ